MKLFRITLARRGFDRVNRGEGFVDIGTNGLDNRDMADARRTLKSKKSSVRGIFGFSAASD